MVAAAINPWNDDPPRVPTLADFGANEEGEIVLEDELGDKAPLKDGSMLYAAMVARAFEATASASATTPFLRATIRFNAGSPVLDSFISPRTIMKTSDIDIVPNGAGDVTVRVAKFPPKRSEPSVDVHEGAAPTQEVIDYADTGWRGARVKTWDGGVATGLKFTVEIF